MIILYTRYYMKLIIIILTTTDVKLVNKDSKA